MSWRPGEVWLDVDAWVIPGDAGAAAVPRLVPPLPFSSPPGLAASRGRRVEQRHRRRTRRARATALALSPAVVVALAGIRSERDAAGRVLIDDPPSAAVRLGPPSTTAPVAGIRTARADKPAAATAKTDQAPVIHWRRAQSLGLPHRGRLVDGTQLPLAGPDWLTWNPVTDRSPNEPGRLYGHERVIRAIVSVARAYRADNPGAPRVVVGDISRKGGGPMRDEHVSHQNGLDADIYFPRRDGTLRSAQSHAQIDHRLAQDLLDRFVAAGAEVVFVGRSTGLRGPAAVVVPYSGHEFHMHVRFPSS